MSREKLLLSLPPDVLALIDERAKWHRMSRSAYVAACALGILGTPDEEARERTRICKICGQLEASAMHHSQSDDPHDDPHHCFVENRVCAACGMSELLHADGQGGHPFEPFKEDT